MLYPLTMGISIISNSSRRAAADAARLSSSSRCSDYARAWRASRQQSGVSQRIFRGPSAAAAAGPGAPPPSSSPVTAPRRFLYGGGDGLRDGFLVPPRIRPASSPGQARRSSADAGAGAAAPGSPAGAEGDAPPSVRAPFASHRASATARRQRAIAGTPSTAAPPSLPGRLARGRRARPPDDDDGEPPTSPFPPDANDDVAGDDSSDPSSRSSPYPSAEPPQSRQAQRKVAIERRRLLLERAGAATTASSLSPAIAPEPENNNATATISNGVVEGIKSGDGEARGSGEACGIGSNDVVAQQSMPQSQEDGQRHHQRRRMIPLHSLGESHLSAADMHRSRLRRMRDREKNERQQEGRGAADRTAPIRERGAAVAEGSRVAAQSATARYRRRRREAGGGSAVDGPAPDQGLEDASDIPPMRAEGPAPSPRPDEGFEDRYRRLRGRRGGSEEDDGAESSRGWSPFGWFWGRKEK